MQYVNISLCLAADTQRIMRFIIFSAFSCNPQIYPSFIQPMFCSGVQSHAGIMKSPTGCTMNPTCNVNYHIQSTGFGW